jgi:hypothetical protein
MFDSIVRIPVFVKRVRFVRNRVLRINDLRRRNQRRSWFLVFLRANPVSLLEQTRTLPRRVAQENKPVSVATAFNKHGYGGQESTDKFFFSRFTTAGEYRTHKKWPADTT